MTSFSDWTRVLLAAAALWLCGGMVMAQEGGGSTAGVLLVQDDTEAAPDDGQSASGLVVRITRLEGQLRQMTGQIEQLQFQNKRLEEQLRKMQQDVDFRFQDLGRTPSGAGRPAGQKRGDLGKPDQTAAAGAADTDSVTPASSLAQPIVVPPLSAGATPSPAAARPARKGDAFDADADPSAPGAPRPLGTTAPSDPLPPKSQRAAASPTPDSVPHAPMELMPNVGLRPAETAGLEPPTRTAPAGTDEPAPVSGSARGDYDADAALYRTGQFDAAITGLQGFLQKYPKDRLAPDATYLLGEGYARLGRHREAAEQFLKVSTDYARSSRAPDALLRLGVSLAALGAKEQACATYQEVDRKFPAATPDVRAGVERELKRARC